MQPNLVDSIGPVLTGLVQVGRGMSVLQSHWIHNLETENFFSQTNDKQH